MRIISVRRGFASDHSSTSYEFLAVDKPLGKKERSEVSRLSSRVRPTGRRAKFIYHAEGYDIPSGWENLMAQYYDVMYREDYGWWTLAMAFNANPGQYEALLPYEFTGADDLGICITKNGQRIILSIYCVIETDILDSDYNDYDHEEDDEGEEDKNDNDSDTLVTDDDLLNLLTQVRRQITDGDYRALYAVWEKYGDDNENPPPKPKSRESGDKIVDTFKGMLSRIEC